MNHEDTSYTLIKIIKKSCRELNYTHQRSKTWQMQTDIYNESACLPCRAVHNIVIHFCLLAIMLWYCIKSNLHIVSFSTVKSQCCRHLFTVSIYRWCIISVHMSPIFQHTLYMWRHMNRGWTSLQGHSQPRRSGATPSIWRVGTGVGGKCRQIFITCQHAYHAWHSTIIPYLSVGRHVVVLHQN